MSIEQIIIRTSPGETNTALLSKGRLVEFLTDRASGSSLVGNIYIGRVRIIQKSLDAAFISIGELQDGFLALPEARPVGQNGGRIGDYLNEGDAVLVQVQRDPIEKKAAKLTTHIHLVGAFLIFRPFHEGETISRRIEGRDIRRNLSIIARNYAPENGGFIVRSKATEAIEEDIKKDATFLIDCWQKILREKNLVSPPVCLFKEENLACQALRDYGNSGLNEVTVQGVDTFCQIEKFCQERLPWIGASISNYNNLGDIFDDYSVTEQLDIAFSNKVDLLSGGFLIINQTSALCAIDVNTGNASGASHEQTAFAVNLEAAELVAFQIRLRNISGLIVIDFVSIRDIDRRKVIIETLKKATVCDSLSVFVAGFTRLGLVEMTRKRHGLSLQHIFSNMEITEIAKSYESQALDALRHVMYEVRNCAQSRGVADVLLQAPLKVIENIKGGGSAEIACKEVENRLGITIRLEVDQTFSDGQFEVVVGNGEERL